MKKSTVLHTALLFLLALVMLLASACTVSYKLRECKSYEALQKLFDKSGKNVVFPDLSPFGFGEFVSYTFDPGKAGTEPKMIVDGDGTVQNRPVSSRFTVWKLKEGETVADKEDPLVYNDVKINRERRETQASNGDPYVTNEYNTVVNGYLYTASMSYTRTAAFTDESAAEFEKTVTDTLYSIMCGVIDSAQKNG